MRQFLVYWKPSTVEGNREMEAIRHTASEQYKKVQTGDVLWIVSSDGPGHLLLFGRQRVDHVLSQRAAEKLLGDNIWESTFHVICDSPEDTGFVDISTIAPTLRFIGTQDRLPDDFTGRNLQSMRRLDSESARELEQIWATRHTLQ